MKLAHVRDHSRSFTPLYNSQRGVKCECKLNTLKIEKRSNNCGNCEKIEMHRPKHGKHLRFETVGLEAQVVA